ncbi:cell division transport system permease protein [Altererythrobacter atlanticus]|uniref:Cell division ABC transporter subunit FtsX n=1 Tax=Croceibacterium atlanticum TaxID=1267766 RepID=A0A0F7KVN9_9SPHN|nr:FtsX-like permease family protein [Croceibacterium atlanticum]AKH43794.1 cell division ABC transporter subunit FtsX [Croceibacterium atlanticum]MBB5733756.1 cell division transport system permease protein [Croceibacterium atlanticum]
MSRAQSLIRRNVLRFGGDRSGLVSQTRLAGPMPWVIAIMIALTVMAAAGGLALGNVTRNAAAEIDGGLTVQLVEAAPAERNRQAEAALTILRNREDVADIRRVPDAELERLLEPWLGAEAGVEEDAIPIPALIDVRLKGPVTERRIEELRGVLVSSAPSARVDAQAEWLGPVFDAIASLQWLAIGLILLLALTSAAAVWLAARSALGSNRDTIEIVHLLGGTDRQIARIFQRSIAMDAAIGGAVGLLLGLGATLLLGRQFGRLGSGMVASGGLEPFDWAVLAAIPLAGIILAMLTARFTVLSALRRML